MGSSSPNNGNNPSNPNVEATAPELVQVNALIYAEGFVIAPFSFQNLGTPIVHCQISPALPEGMSITVADGTCRIEGTPSQLADATDYVITASDNEGRETTLIVTITVRIPVPPSVSDVGVQSFVATLDVEDILLINNGDPAVQCSITPALPAGMNIGVSNGSCIITGRPQASHPATDYVITVTALDGSTDTATFNLEIIAASPPALENGGTHSFITTEDITPIQFVNNGSPAVACQVTPSLPQGLILSLEDDSCTISGTPLVDALQTTYHVTATAADGTSSVASLEFAIVLTSSPVIMNITAVQNFAINEPISTLRLVNTGSPALSCSSSPLLPAGLEINAVDGTCEISGTPTASGSATVYTITAISADNSSHTATVTIAVLGVCDAVAANYREGSLVIPHYASAAGYQSTTKWYEVSADCRYINANKSTVEISSYELQNYEGSTYLYTHPNGDLFSNNGNNNLTQVVPQGSSYCQLNMGENLANFGSHCYEGTQPQYRTSGEWACPAGYMFKRLSYWGGAGCAKDGVFDPYMDPTINYYDADTEELYYEAAIKRYNDTKAAFSQGCVVLHCGMGGPGWFSYCEANPTLSYYGTLAECLPNFPPNPPSPDDGP